VSDKAIHLLKRAFTHDYIYTMKRYFGSEYDNVLAMIEKLYSGEEI
jgi:hypothetical protein